MTVLRRADLAITHGGNNSVTEALTCGVPIVVLSFSTDQFGGAAAIEYACLGGALDPNTTTVDDLRAAAQRPVKNGGRRPRPSGCPSAPRRTRSRGARVGAP